ncbi:ATP-binding protein [Acidovorax sp.]|uniref:ATP-binding protein n=1 Tax=Acidovorax sp. TaxID=1872122 RepID=UPI003D006B59
MIDWKSDSEDDFSFLLPDKIIWTPEIEKVNQFIIESMRMQSRGCAVMGQQCNGKSFATRYLMSLLPMSLGHRVAVVRWSIAGSGGRIARRERAFVQDRLIQSGCMAVAHRDVAILWRRFLMHLSEMAISAGSRSIVIMIDEAQNLQYEEYNWLIHCFNGLEDLNIRPFFMLVGQPELGNATESWKETNGMQVIGRFFTRRHWFYGIGIDDIEVVLDAFDEPHEDGGFLSGQLMPQILGTEWRMSAWASLYKEAMEVLMVEHNIPEGLHLPMQMLRSSLLLVLNRVITEKKDPRQVSTASVLQALKDTGFTSSLAYYIKR